MRKIIITGFVKRKKTLLNSHLTEKYRLKIGELKTKIIPLHFTIMPELCAGAKKLDNVLFGLFVHGEILRNNNNLIISHRFFQNIFFFKI